MSKKQTVNREKWLFKSNAQIKSRVTEQRGHIFSKGELRSEANDKTKNIECMWKGHQFLAKDWTEALQYVYKYEEIID